MLVKKYLDTIPAPKVKINKTSEKKYFITAEIVKSEKYGEIYTATIFEKDGTINTRIFCDGVSAIRKVGENWTNNKILPQSYYSYNEYKDLGDGKQITDSFFKDKGIFTSIYKKSVEMIDDFITKKRTEKRWKYEDNKNQRMKEHIALCPGDPKNLGEYADKYVFKNKYIMFSKKDKKTGKRSCICLACGKKYTEKIELKHKQLYTCPKCKTESIAIADRFIASVRDEEKICFINNVNGTLVTAWKKIERKYSENGKARYETTTYFYDILTAESKRYYYKMVTTYYFRGFAKTKYSNAGDRTYIYADNMKDVYEGGISTYGLNMNQIRYAGEVDLITLMNASAKTSTAKELYKIGLYRLAECGDALPQESTFQEVLKVSKSYLPIFKKVNITITELRVIQMAGCHLHDEIIEKIVKLCRKTDYNDLIGRLEKLKKWMSLIKATNYFHRQMDMLGGKHGWATMIGFYLDYISMTKQFNKGKRRSQQIEMTSSLFLYPRNIKDAHDRIASKIRIEKNKKSEHKVKMLAKKYNREIGFENKKLCIIYPTSIDDFIKEGTELGHCVGSGDRYYNNHAEEKEITIFVRKKEEKEKPFYTATFCAEKITLKECYGTGHKTPTESVREFLKKYETFLKDKLGTMKQAAA